MKIYKYVYSKSNKNFFEYSHEIINIYRHDGTVIFTNKLKNGIEVNHHYEYINVFYSQSGVGLFFKKVEKEKLLRLMNMEE